MRRRNVNLRLLQLLLLCVAGIIVMRMFGAAAASSILFTMTFPLTCSLWLWNVRKGLKRQDYYMIGMAALTVFCVMVDLLLNGGTFSFSYVRKVIMFMMTLLYLQVMSKLRPDWRLEEFFQMLVDLLTLLMIVMLFLCWEDMHRINGVVSRYMTFGFDNPNMVAMYLAPMYMMTFCSQLKSGNSKVVLFRRCLLLVQVALILGTQSRNALLVIVLFTAVALVVLSRGKIHQITGIRITLRYGRLLSWMIALFPIAFAVLYMVLIDSEWVSKLFGFMVSEGKDLDSRVKEWAPAFAVILKSPLIGSYYGISGGTGSSQMHNTHVDTAACYGIPVMLIMCYMQKCYIFQGGKKYKYKGNFLYMAAFCCSLLMGTFEAAIYSGGLGIYVFALIFLALSRGRGRKKTKCAISGWEWLAIRGERIGNVLKGMRNRKTDK